ARAMRASPMTSLRSSVRRSCDSALAAERAALRTLASAPASSPDKAARPSSAPAIGPRALALPFHEFMLPAPWRGPLAAERQRAHAPVTHIPIGRVGQEKRPYARDFTRFSASELGEEGPNRRARERRRLVDTVEGAPVHRIAVGAALIRDAAIRRRRHRR